MKKRILGIAGAAVLAVGVISAAPASANAQFGCTTALSALHATYTRINYGNGQSAIYASATGSYKEVRSLAPDITWTFSSFSSGTGLPKRTNNPTQWGNTTWPLDLSTEYVTTTWKGTAALTVDPYWKQCGAWVN